MVGGIIIGFARGKDSTLVNVCDKTYGDTCAVRIVEERRDSGERIEIRIGDMLWWQGSDAMWTPQHVMNTSVHIGCGRTWDIHLPKIGYSH
jgi:hypothetical protein